MVTSPWVSITFRQPHTQAFRLLGERMPGDTHLHVNGYNNLGNLRTELCFTGVYGKAGHGQWTRTRTVDTDKNRRVATDIMMIGASIIASTFLVSCVP